MSRYYLSLGSNMGDRAGYLSKAIQEMEAEGILIERKSALYETLPWGKTDQPLFLNAAAAVCWNGEAAALMERLLAIESRCGRVRTEHWGPRTLDLDLLYGEGIVSDTARLRLPHPYLWDRAFVLVPLAEIAPDFCFHGERIQDRIAALHGENAVKVYRREWKGEKEWTES